MLDTRKNILAASNDKFKVGEWDKRCQIEFIMDEPDFFLQKAQDAYNDFIDFDDYDPDKLGKISRAIDTEKNIAGKGRPDLNKIFKEREMDCILLDKIHRLMSYFMESYPNKNQYNEYNPHRDVAYARMPPNYWIIQLIEVKLGGGLNCLSPTPRYTINYINDPGHNISIVKKCHRESLSRKLLGKEVLDDNNFCADIVNVFVEHQNKVANPINFSILCARMLYDKEVVSIWN